MPGKSSENVGTKMIFEDDHIRLWELVVEPFGTVDEHIHRLNYAYFVTSGGLLRFEDGENPEKYHDSDFKDNQVSYVSIPEEGKIDGRITNIGTRPHRNYVIEVKNPLHERDARRTS